MLFIGSAQNGGHLHGYKRAFDGFSGIFNWIPERATGSLRWDFLFILGRSIAWYSYVRMVLNHPGKRVSRNYTAIKVPREFTWKSKSKMFRDIFSFGFNWPREKTIKITLHEVHLRKI